MHSEKRSSTKKESPVTLGYKNGLLASEESPNRASLYLDLIQIKSNFFSNTNKKCQQHLWSRHHAVSPETMFWKLVNKHKFQAEMSNMSKQKIIWGFVF